MILNLQKEAFSRAYVQAIASVAGFNCTQQAYDTDSIDIGFKSPDNPFGIIEAQLKATSNSDYVINNVIHFPLPLKNYNDLRGETVTPRILIVLLLNETNTSVDWINQTSEQLALKKCAYWINLRDKPESQNKDSVTITIPMDENHIFTPSVLPNLINQFLSLVSRRG